MEIVGQDAKDSSRYLIYNYMRFIGYETHEKLIGTSCEGFRIINTISKQGIQKSNINKTYTSSTLGFSCSTHKETCDILSEYLVSHILQTYSSRNKEGLLSYIEGEIKTWHWTPKNLWLSALW